MVAPQKSFLGDHVEDLAFDNPSCEQSGFGQLVKVLFFPYDCFTKAWLIIGFKDLTPFGALTFDNSGCEQSGFGQLVGELLFLEGRLMSSCHPVLLGKNHNGRGD